MFQIGSWSWLYFQHLYWSLTLAPSKRVGLEAFWGEREERQTITTKVCWWSPSLVGCSSRVQNLHAGVCRCFDVEMVWSVFRVLGTPQRLAKGEIPVQCHLCPSHASTLLTYSLLQQNADMFWWVLTLPVLFWPFDVLWPLAHGPRKHLRSRQWLLHLRMIWYCWRKLVGCFWHAWSRDKATCL